LKARREREIEAIQAVLDSLVRGARVLVLD
jgi:hypothetical protein